MGTRKGSKEADPQPIPTGLSHDVERTRDVYCKDNLRYRARTTTATIALVAGSYLVMSGTTAEPAAGQGSSEARNGGWLTQVWPGASRVEPADGQADAQYVGAYSKERAADAPPTQRQPNAAKWTARKIFSDPVRSMTRPTTPRRRSTSTARRARSSRRARPRARSPAIHLRPIRREQHPPGSIESAAAGPRRLRRLADGGRLQQQQRQGYCADRDPAEHRRRLQDHRHRTNTRLLHAASEEQQIHPLRVRRRRRRREIQR